MDLVYAWGFCFLGEVFLVFLILVGVLLEIGHVGTIGFHYSHQEFYAILEVYEQQIYHLTRQLNSITYRNNKGHRRPQMVLSRRRKPLNK